MAGTLKGEVEQGARVIQLPGNFGPSFALRHKEIRDLLPQVFILSDPDLQLNEAMPDDFLEILRGLTNEFKIGKAGVALDISRPEELSDERLRLGTRDYSIVEWESQFWRLRVETQSGLEVYAAEVDTIFALCNQEYLNPDSLNQGVRVAGSFVAKHLPWYKKSMLSSQELDLYGRTTRQSHWI